MISTAPGVYYENIGIRQKHNITIVGAGADVTVIDGGGNGHVVVFNVANGVISGFTITNSGNSPLYSAGIFSSQCAVLIEECVLQGNNYGIKFSSNSQGTLCRSRVVNNSNMAVDYSSSSGFVLNNVIANNNRRGVDCTYNSDVDVINNTIVNNGFAAISCSPTDVMNICNNIISSHEFAIMSIGQNSINYLNISHNNCYNNDHNYWYEWGIFCIPEDPDCISEGESRAFVPIPGVGEMYINPMFANNNDYHLVSEHGRWDSISRQWVEDDVTSPCIDAGSLSTPIGPEPFPNGGIINMGAYGGTPKASKSYFGAEPCVTIVAGDINGDCVVNLADLSIMAFHWLESSAPL